MLLAGVGSVSVAVTEAVLLIFVEAGGLITIVTVVCAPPFNVPRLQVTVDVPVQEP